MSDNRVHVTIRIRVARVSGKPRQQKEIDASVAARAREHLPSHVWVNGSQYSVMDAWAVNDKPVAPAEYAAGDDIEVFEETDQGTYDWQPGKVIKVINNLIRVQTNSGRRIYYDRSDTVIRKPA